ncbi:MAG: hypothetical protein ABFC18_03445 [Rikenellaceae bacterium]
MENLIIKIVLNILGIVTFFWVRFANRTDKTAQPNLKFWLKDNFEQLIGILLIDVAVILLVFANGLKLSFDKIASLPEWVQLTGDSVIFYLTGLIFALLGYEAIKKVILEKK